MQGERRALGTVCPNNMWVPGRRATAVRKSAVLMPRSSSPVTLLVQEKPCAVEQAFSTIAWDELEESTPVRQERDSLGSQVSESGGDDQDFGDYALDFMEDSSAMLEDSLSPAGLVPFQGYVIPPLTPQDISPGNSFSHPSLVAQDGVPCQGSTQHQSRVLGNAIQSNNQLHRILHQKQEEVELLQEKNLHLWELASRAKHLAAVLEKLMTVRDPCLREPATPSGDRTPSSTSPCKRQRVDDSECETVTPGSVEDILRDISTRCNAVLHSGAGGPRPQQDPDGIRVYGSFSGLQTSIRRGHSASADETEAGESDSSFRTSVRDHCTIRTQVFPHGHAFTSRTQHGAYRFRWVPSHS